MKQLQDAEKELKRKQDDAEQDMMMAGMVSDAGRWQQWQEGSFSLLSWQCKLFSLLSSCKDSTESSQNSASSKFNVGLKTRD